MKTKKYRPWNLDQTLLLPPSMRDWLPEGHLAWFILDLVGQLELSPITDVIHAKDPRENRPYDPAMLVALLLYAWCVGIRSSRAIARLTWTDLAMRVLSGDTHPVYSTLIHFRSTHVDALAGLFVQVLQIAQHAGLVGLTHVAVDGTKVQAAASKHKAMSYERMKVSKVRLEAEVAAILAEAEQVDQQEDVLYGKDSDGDVVPPELRRRQARLAKIEEAMASLEEEARQARAQDLRELAERNRERAQTAEAAPERKRAETRARKQEEQAREMDPPDDDEGDKPPTPPRFETLEGLPKNRPPRQPDGTPKGKAQRNFTDPDSRIMERGGAYLQGYNCQLAVDAKHQVIVAHAVTNQAPDSGNLEPMLRLTRENCGRPPENATADTGYWTARVEASCRELGTEVYVATGRLRRGEAPPPTSAEPISPELTGKARMKARLDTPEGRALYRMRKAVVEPVNGQIKDARNLRRFLRRGLGAVRQDWSLEATCHNILKLHRSGWTLEPATS